MSILGTEADFENLIVDSLQKDNNYELGNKTEYNKQTGLLELTLIKFIKKTQTNEWKKLVAKFSNEVEAQEEFLSEFEKKRTNSGILSVFRTSLSVRGINFDIVYWKPDNTINDDTQKLYKQNIFTVINQLRITTQNQEKTAIPDIVLFVNGIPIVTVELKYTPQGQCYLNAEMQYKDRNTSEPLFKFKYGALVHFAVDENYVSMTTKLNGNDTFFLPFNMGSNGAGNAGGEGNPVAPKGKYKTYYLWEHIFTKDSLLDILQSYLTVEVDKKNNNETLIFPRFHQFDVVNKLLSDVMDNGSSKNYLIEHSAGSGKSNTIAWLAFHLQNLYFSKRNEKIFDSIIIINDRRVLDKQTRDTIQSFNPKKGTVVEAKKSTDIIEGIKVGNVIIISTIQKFPMIYKKLVEIVSKHPEKRYAVIADEAHQSQSGNAAGKLKIGLSSDTKQTSNVYSLNSSKDHLQVAEKQSTYVGKNDDDDEDYELEEGESSVKEQDEVLEEIAKGKQKNISFFAFTATPTKETLQMFGVPSNATSSGSGKDRTFRAFHIYSMQQAIEENFILDVLTNYTTYKQYFELSVKTKKTLQYDEKTLLRETKKMIGNHDFRIRKIVEYICEHFESIGSKTIDSEGKAMIVTSSRQEAVKYTKILRDYLSTKGHSDWGVLVAISGEIDNHTERYYNSFPQNPLCKKGTIITENQTAATFHEKEYRFLVVADKYQTGFSEKLLSCMYVDKKLKDIRAVQTLSRLNRTIGGGKKTSETDCFVVDFVNERKVIQEAFQKFYGDIKLTSEVTLTDLYNAKTSIDNCGLIVKSEIDEFIKLYGQKLVAKNKKDVDTVKSLNTDIDNLIQNNLIQRYKTKPENEQKEFFEKCRDFNKKFLFLQNIVSITDADLVYFGLYITILINPLKTCNIAPHLVGNTQIEIEKLLSLSSYRIDDKITGAIQLSKGNNTTVNTISTAKGTKPPAAITTVHKLVTELNQRLSTDFTDEDIVPVIEVFKKSFEADKNFCNENVIRQENIFKDKYQGVEGAKVFSNALNSNQIKKEVVAAIRKPNVYQCIKDELCFPIYEHLKSVLKIA